MKSILKYLLSVIVVSSIIIYTNYKYPNHLKYIDDKIVDILFTTNNNEEFNNNVTIVDIDNISIHEIGQWPWSRNNMARLVQNLNTMNPTVIGFGIIFSEEDRTSPSNFQNNSKVKLENYDETFGLSIEDSDVPIVLGYNFLSTQSDVENHIVPYVPAVFASKVSDNIEFLEPASTLLNIPIIQESSYSSGFLNSITNENGRVISSPLLMKYKNQLLPSLALELIRTIYSTRQIYVQNNQKLGNYINIEDLSIPVDSDSAMRLNYTRSFEKIKHISAVDIIKKDFSKFDASNIEGKIVIVGSNASGLSMNTPTPFGTQISTIDLQALVIENLISKKYLIKPYWAENFSYASTIIIAMLILLTIFYSSILFNVISSLILAIVSYILLAYFFHEEGFLLNSAYIIESILLSMTISIAMHFIKNRDDLLNVKGKFASKVSKQVMDDLLDTTNKKGDLSSRRKNVTIFFSDIKGFTKITEKIDDPQKLTLFINRYMDAMTKNIMINNEGTVDKFMGDAIMAYWNAPYEVENHSDKALTSAIEQVELLDELNELNMLEKMPMIQIRIGMTAGEVFVGEVGGELRNDYTIMGKNVNHAAVLEQAGKYYSANIIISQSVKDNLLNNYVILLLDIMQVDGTSDAFNIYQVFYKNKADKFTQDFIDSFEKAVMLYRDSDIDNSIIIFRNLLLDESCLNSKLCKIYIKRCEEAYIDLANGSFVPIQSIDKSFIAG